jgi:AcrR family transcriptional regulator
MDPDEPCARKRGRPARGTEQTRRQALLQAAQDSFMEQGFGASSMEAIARRAGVSKKTIYGCVTTKEELFEAVMKDLVEHSPIPSLPDEVADAAALEAALLEHLTAAATLRLVPFVVRLNQVTIAEAPRFPKIAETFYREGPLRHVEQLAAWLRKQTARGLIAVEDPEDAAVMLSTPMIGEPLRAAVLGVRELPSPDAIAARARTITRTFLKGCLRT